MESKDGYMTPILLATTPVPEADSKDGYMTPIVLATTPVPEADYEARYVNVNRVEDAVDKPSTSQAEEGGIKQQPSGIYESVYATAAGKADLLSVETSENVKKLNEKVEKMATEIEATSKQLEESLERLEHRPLDLFQRPNVKNSKGNLSKSTCIVLAVLIAFISIVFAVVAFVVVSKIKDQNDENLRHAVARIDALEAQLMNKSENSDAFENRVRVIMKNNSLGITEIKDKMDETSILANKTMKDLGSHISATRCASYPCQNGGTCSQNSTPHHCRCVSGFVGANCEISLNATGWFQESNHLWYKLFESKLNHNQSEANCSAAGARLASTGLRNQTVFSSITAYLRTKLNTGVWIGLEKVGGVWEWSDGVKANGAWSNSCVLISRAGLELTGISCNSVKHHLCEQ